MKRIAIVVLILLLLAATVASYRSYKQRAAHELAETRAILDAREAAARQRTAAVEEAQRLAALQAAQESAQADQELAALRAQEEAATARREAAEIERLRLQAGVEQLHRESDALAAEVKRLAENRSADASVIEAAQKDALAKLHAVETERLDLANRQAAQAAALARQIEAERAAEERVAKYRAATTP